MVNHWCLKPQKVKSVSGQRDDYASQLLNLDRMPLRVTWASLERDSCLSPASEAAKERAQGLDWE